MVPGVEVDDLVLAQPLVTMRMQSEETAERRNRAGGEAGQFQDFFPCGESHLLPVLGSADRAAVEFPVSGNDEHDEALLALDDEGLGPAGQRRSTDPGGLLAGADRFVPQHLERNAVLLEKALHTVEDG